MTGAKKTTYRPLRVAVFAVLLLGLWLLCTAALKQDELLLGAASALLSTLFAVAVARQYETPLHFKLRDCLQFWRIPGYVVTQVWSITVVLAKDFAGKRAASLYRVCPFDFSGTNPVNNARRVLAASYTTTAPNFIVIGIDTKKREMLFHQIERTEIPEMTKMLGARP